MMNRRGLTLLELLVVVAIVAPVTITILSALGQARQGRTETATRLAALQAVQQEIDAQRIALVTQPGNQVLPQTSSEPVVTTSSIQLRTGTPAVMTLTRSLHPTGLLQLEGEVSFPGWAEGLHPVRLTTLAATPSSTANPTEAGQ